MKRHLVLILLLLLSGMAPISDAAQPLPGSVWTGGFWLEGKWVAVNVRYSGQNQNSGGTADLISPYYGGSENAINVALDNLKQTGDGLHFEVPVQTRKAIFDGRQNRPATRGTSLRFIRTQITACSRASRAVQAPAAQRRTLPQVCGS